MSRNETHPKDTVRILEEFRKVHQGLMDSLQSLMEFAYPQLLLEFTALFLSCLTKMFFSQEAATRCMLRQAISMGSLALWIVVVVFIFCYISQKMKDQESFAFHVPLR